MTHQKTNWMLALLQVCLVASAASSFAADRKIYVANEGAHNVKISPDGKHPAHVVLANNGITVAP